MNFIGFNPTFSLGGGNQSLDQVLAIGDRIPKIIQPFFQGNLDLEADDRFKNILLSNNIINQNKIIWVTTDCLIDQAEFIIENTSDYELKIKPKDGIALICDNPIIPKNAIAKIKCLGNQLSSTFLVTYETNSASSPTDLIGTNQTLLVLNGTPTANGIKFRAAYNAITTTPYSLMTLGGTIDYLPPLVKNFVNIGSLDKTNPLVVEQGTDYSAFNLENVSIINLVIPELKYKNITYNKFNNITGDISATNILGNNIFKNITGNISATGISNNNVFNNITGNISATNIKTNNIFENITGDITATNIIDNNSFNNITGNISATTNISNITIKNSTITTLTPIPTSGLIYNSQLPNDALGATVKYRNCIDLSGEVIINN